MIRINLLAVERERTKRRGLIAPAQRVTIIASLILVATVLGIGWWYWSLRQESLQVDEDTRKAELEMQQLRSVLSQVRQFEASKAALQQRVSLIEQLRRGQSGAVHVIDEISKAVPDYLWLTEIVQKGEDLTIAGMTTSHTGVSDFMGNLASSSWFKGVDLIDSQEDASQKTSVVVKFSIKAKVFNPEAPAAPGPGRGGRGAPAAPGR